MTEQQTAIQRSQPAAVYQQSETVIALAERMRKMIPGAADAPNAAIWKAAQIASLHRLDPFAGDVWVYPAYKGCRDEEWIVDPGIGAWRRAAQRQAKYSLRHELLTDDETAARIGEHYTPGDVGMKCTLWRLDVARECKELGIPYEPTVAYGFFRNKARYIQSRKEWFSDQLANTETKEDKAQKRAEKKALRAAFTLEFADEIMVGDNQEWSVSESDSALVRRIEDKISSEERARTIIHRDEPEREADGDILWIGE